MRETQKRTLGESGLGVSTIGLGCNNFGRANTVTASVEGTRAVLEAALDAGVTLFDTADLYGATPGLSESLMGEVLEGRRDEFVLATKFGHRALSLPGAQEWGPKGGRTYIRNSVEGSLRRLRTDHIDLYQMHNADPGVPIEETLAALSELVDEGKVRYIGHTTLTAEQLVEADEVAEAHGFTRFISAQNEYSLLQRSPEAGILPEVRRAGMGFLPFFPLANGLLSGKYTEANRPADGRLTTLKPELLEGVDWQQLTDYQALCDEAGLSMLQATFGWLLSRDVLTSVIAGATTPEQIRMNAEAAQTVLDDDFVDRVNEIFSDREAG